MLKTLRFDRLLALGDELEGTTNWAIYNNDWGQWKSATVPVVGNHDVESGGFPAYCAYFGAIAHCPQGYHSVDIGAWHIVVLDSETTHSAGSAQELWLKADLAAHKTGCQAVLIHRPRFSSGQHSDNADEQALWADAANAGVDLWISGHDHIYERFAPMNASGGASATGMTEFVLGTGGRPLYSYSSAKTNSLVRNNKTFGVGQFTFTNIGWSEVFEPVAGSSFTDSASGSCH